MMVVEMDELTSGLENPCEVPSHGSVIRERTGDH